MDQYKLEEFKHKLKRKEIILEKLILVGVLSLLFFALGYIGDQRLAGYKNSLQEKLAQLKEDYQYERVLATNEIRAHEKIWIAVAAFRKITNSYLETKYKAEAVENIQKHNLELVKVLEENEIYLSAETRNLLIRFEEQGIREFLDSWEAEEEQVLSMRSWRVLADYTDQLRDKIRADIHKPRTAR